MRTVLIVALVGIAALAAYFLLFSKKAAGATPPVDPLKGVKPGVYLTGKTVTRNGVALPEGVGVMGPAINTTAKYAALGAAMEQSNMDGGTRSIGV